MGQPVKPVVTQEMLIEGEMKVLVSEVSTDGRVRRKAFVNYMLDRGLRKKQARYIFKILDKDKKKSISEAVFTSFIMDVIQSENDSHLLRMIFSSCNKKSKKEPDKDYLTPKEFKKFCYFFCGKWKRNRLRTRRKIARDPNKITLKEIVAWFYCKRNV